MYQSILFVPAIRPDLIPKAMMAGADAVCIDMEDSVPPDRKREARDIIASLPFESPANVVQCLRINALTTREGILDLAALAQSAVKPDVLVLPKVTSPAELSIVAAACGAETPVIAIIESTAGLDAVLEIAAHALTHALLFGSADFSAEIGSTMDWDSLLYARSKVIAAAAANGKKALDGVWTDIHDATGLVDNTKRLKALGFFGRAAIHPKQIPGIRLGFAPTASDLEFARAAVQAFENAGGTAVQVNGKMVDKPIYDIARSLLRQYSSPND
jgi:(S)-citramalyl-CoA lyase